MRAKKNREVNIFSASVVDLFASGLGVFLIVAIIALVNQKKENLKVLNPKEVNLENEKLIANLEKKLSEMEAELEKSQKKVIVLKSELTNSQIEDSGKKVEKSFEEKLALKKKSDFSSKIINQQKDTIQEMSEKVTAQNLKIKELEKSIESLKEIYREQKLEAEENKLDVSKFQIGTKIQLNNVQFYAGTEKPIEPYATREIKELAKVLLENRSIKVEVSGHIFLSKEELEKGNAYDDSNLSDRRAQVVCDKLISLGVNSKRLKCLGYGGKRYLFLTDDQYSEEAQLNRRVEIEVLSK